MNIYQRLEAKGWTWINGNSRRDFYKKGKWFCCVPSSTIGKIKFWKRVTS